MDRRSFITAAAAVAAGAPLINAIGATGAIADGAVPLIPAATPIVQEVIAGGVGPGLALSLQLLDEAIDSADAPTHLIMSKRMRNLLSMGSRYTSTPGFIVWDKDEHGNRQAFYNDLPIIVTDYDAEGNQILDFNEGDDNTTSIYVLADSDEANQTVGALVDLPDTIEHDMPASAINSMAQEDRTAYYEKRRFMRTAAEEALGRKLIALSPVRLSGIGKTAIVD